MSVSRRVAGDAELHGQTPAAPLRSVEESEDARDGVQKRGATEPPILAVHHLHHHEHPERRAREGAAGAAGERVRVPVFETASTFDERHAFFIDAASLLLGRQLGIPLYESHPRQAIKYSRRVRCGWLISRATLSSKNFPSYLSL